MQFSIFCISCSLVVINALLVVFTRNALHAILFLASCFFFSSITILLLENEFLALFFAIIYLGAIIVLFLFVVMMLDLKQNILKTNKVHFAVGAGIVVFMFFSICKDFSLIQANTDNWKIYEESSIFYLNWSLYLDSTSDVVVFAKFFYANYAPQLIISGILLYISVVGVVFLTSKRSKTNSIKGKQLLTRQLSRTNIL